MSKRKTARAYRRRYTAKKRTYRKKPAMSNKRILNISSRKKRDTMLNWTNMTAASQSGSTTYTTAPAVITGGTALVPLTAWSPTARDLNRNSGAGGVVDVATRTSSTCFMRGIKESIEVQVVNGVPWQWRRIVFSCKGLYRDVGITPSFAMVQETSNGMVRPFNQPTGQDRLNLEAIVFRGTVNIDWLDQIIAPIDTTRVTLMYDKTRTISSGNQDGVIRKYNFWHGFNKNLVYDDDEKGDSMSTTNWSVTSKPGMGDVFIIDMFRSRSGATSSDQIAVSSTATLYWHEK